MTVKAVLNFALASIYVVGGAVILWAAEPALRKKPVPVPVPRPAAVAPQGGISFGESAAPSPAQQRRAMLRWPEMTQQEIDGLTVLLKNVKNPVPVLIGCQDSLCEDLALNLDNAFESARWKTNIVIGSPFGVPDGISGSAPWIVDLFNSATGGRYGAKVDPDNAPQVSGGEYLLIGPKPR